jgi:hypothetical protein
MPSNLASKYSPKVDERFASESFTEGIGFNKDYNWDGVATVTVYDIPTVALGDYTKSGTSRYGVLADLEDTKTDYTISRDRAFTYGIDEGDSRSQLDIKKKEGRSLGREIREVVTPEIDKYRLKKMHNMAIETSQKVTASGLAANNAYSKFLDANAFLDEAEVPQTGRVAFVSPTMYNYLKQDSAFIKYGDLSQKMLLKGQVGEVDGVKIIKVPSNYFQTGTECIIIHPKCMVCPNKLKDYVTHVNPMGYNGVVVEGRIMYDAFILKSKKKAVASITTATVSA